MHFFIRSITDEGRIALHFMEADDYAQLTKKLKQQKALSLNVYPLPKILSVVIPKKGSKVSTDEVVELIESLHLIIKSGLPLYQGLHDLAQDSNNKRFKEMLLYIADGVNNGKSLSNSLETYKNVIGKIILNLIKIGEDTGQLETTLLRSAQFLKKTIALKKKAKGALIYPSFALLAVSSAMFVWMIYVLPQMTSLFEDMDIELPTLTLAIMAVSDFLTHYSLYMFGIIITLVIIYVITLKKNRTLRLYTDKLLLKIPVIKQIISGFNIAFIAEYIKLTLVSGAPVYDSLNSLTLNLKNECFKDALESTAKDVSKGSQISTAFAKTKMFTPFTIRMISVGESAGSLDTQLELISNYYYEKVDYYAENIGKVIEPLVLIFVGAFMALVIVGLMGPMYDLISKIQ